MKEEISYIRIRFFVIVAGLVMIYVSIIYLQTNNSKWPSTEAWVVSSRETAPIGGEDKPAHEVIYEYEVDGVKYSGIDIFSSQLAVEDKMTVFYDPANPENEVFKRGNNVYGIVGLILGILIAGGTLWRWIKDAIDRRREGF